MGNDISAHGEILYVHTANAFILVSLENHNKNSISLSYTDVLRVTCDGSALK